MRFENPFLNGISFGFKKIQPIRYDINLQICEQVSDGIVNKIKEDIGIKIWQQVNSELANQIFLSLQKK